MCRVGGLSACTAFADRPPTPAFASLRPTLPTARAGGGMVKARPQPLTPHFTVTRFRSNQTIAPLIAGGLVRSWLHWLCEAVSRVRSHISPGPYRSFRELSLAGSVDPVIWCPPTFVGNSGIEHSNGHRGFALFLCCCRVCSAHQPPPLPSYPAKAGYPVRRGDAVYRRCPEYRITQLGVMTPHKFER
jgi:hypothetical protein